MASDALDAGHLIGHVKDATFFEVPRFFDSFDVFGLIDIHGSAAHLNIPQPFQLAQGIELKTGFAPIDNLLEPLDFQITKFMVLQVVGAVIVGLIYVWLARKVREGDRPTGRLWNMFESVIVFIRDEVARPAIGHDADKHLPFIWNLFFFVLIGNLLGMVPWAGSPTGAFAATGALALITFCVVVGAGMAKMGPIGFWVGQVPHMDLPLPLAIALKPMIFLIEVLGLCIKHFVLAVRLLANMMAGHLVLAVLLAFIAAAANSIAFWGVMPASILGAFALSLLELFVAFLQAYIFAFLASLFIGMAVHPH